MPRRPEARGSWTAVDLAVRLRNRLLTACARGTLAALGEGSVLQWPIELDGLDRISIGRDVQIGAGSRLSVISPDGRLELADGVRVTGRLFVSVAQDVRIEERALLAHNVFISDHSHAFEHPTRAVMDQGTTVPQPVRIREGAWLGFGAVILPGVTVGRRAVVGANSVVREDVPDGAVAAGVPARIVRPAMVHE